MDLNGKNVVLVSSWSQNIGNAFFSVSGRWIMEQAAPGARVTWFQDQPGYRTFHNQTRGNPQNHASLIASLDVDYLVLQGPMLTSTFRAIWEPSFRALRERGTKIVLLSAGLFRYTSEEIASVREFLSEYPPAILATRDSVTYSHFHDLCEISYDGIESAFCIPDAYQPPKIDYPSFAAVCFDRYPEPEIVIGGQPSPSAPNGRSGSFEFEDATWNWTFPRIPYLLAKKGQGVAYLGAMADRRKSMPNALNGLAILRPEHRTNPFIGWKVYRRPGAVATDEPYTYLATYANAELTLTDRVHSGVVALAYGTPAMLFGATPRDALFERMGIADIRRHPVTLPEEQRVAEREKLVDFLRSGLERLESRGQRS